MNTMGSHEWRGSPPQHDEIERLQHNLQVTTEIKDKYVALADELLAEIEQLRAKVDSLTAISSENYENLTGWQSACLNAERERDELRAKVAELNSLCEFNERTMGIQQQAMESQAAQIKLARDALSKYRITGDDDDCMKALAALDSAEQVEPVSQWISVDDRLPETTDDVLVCDGKLVMIAEYWKATENEIADGWCDSYNGEEIEQITHWMPLPKPPAREGK